MNLELEMNSIIISSAGLLNVKKYAFSFLFQRLYSHLLQAVFVIIN